MTAYMIVQAEIKDRESFIRGYAPAAAELVTKFGGKYLVRAPAAEILEGHAEAPKAVVVSEWPDKASIKRFWDSPEYQEVKQLRDQIADCQVFVVEGTDAPA